MILNFEQVYKSYGDRQLLENVTFYLKSGDRLGVLGVNGCGKSTLLKIAAGREAPDTGKVSYDPNVRASYLPQIPEDDPDNTVTDQVLAGQPENARELARYEAEIILTTLGITDMNARIGELSGGQRKRVALAQCLASPADLLVLDEPTNHLDIEMIDWLENYLSGFGGAVLFVTHDRYFLEHTANRTAEVTFGKAYFNDGGYSSWLDASARRLEMNAASERKRQSTLRRELAWVLQGPCARGTKSRERLERYAELKAQLPPQTEEKMTDIQTVSSRLGRKTIELDNVSKSYGGRTIISGFSYNVLRNDRIGIIGRNGSGKTTLLNLMAGTGVPDSGKVETGETVRIGYFTQHSDAMDGNQTALQYVKERGERIMTRDGYLSAEKLMEMFLFSGPLQHRQIGRLSGGEKRRLFLLGILAASPNILLLDEPTNDLDIQTMQVLENFLVQFDGAVAAVSHDRYFIDRICSHVFAVSPGNGIKDYVGGYTDYEAAVERADESGSAKRPKEHSVGYQRTRREDKLKFSFREQREFDTIEEDIAALEAELKAISKEEEENSTDYVALEKIYARRQETEAALENKMERWVYLTDLAEKIAGAKPV